MAESIAALACTPCMMMLCCYKDVRRKWKHLLCCQPSDKSPQRKRSVLSEDKHIRPTKITDKAEKWEEMGNEPTHFASKLFMDLLNKSYSYLILFIISAVVCLVLVFWFPFIVLVLTNSCPGTATTAVSASLNTTALVCRPAISEANDAFDAFAVAFASLFAVPTHYTANSVIAVTLVTIEFAVGKLAVAALTALLVIKVSRVPNNLVLSHRILLHKPRDHWMLSMRAGILHRQTISGCSFRLVAVMKVGSKFEMVDLPFQSSKLRAGSIALKQEPITFSHVVDEQSPLYHFDFSSIRNLKKDLLSVNVSIHGFDDTTGRSLGLERKYNYDRWNTTGGHMVLMERGKLAQVVRRLSDKEVKRSGAKYSLAIEWPNFNLIKEESIKRWSYSFNQNIQLNHKLGGGGGGGGRRDGRAEGTSKYHVQSGSNQQDLRQRGKNSKEDDWEQPWSCLNAGPDPDRRSEYRPSDLAMALTPRSLSQKIQSLKEELLEMSKSASLTPKASPASSIKNTVPDSTTIMAEEEEEMFRKIDRTREDWTSSHLDLARQKYDHLKKTVDEKRKSLKIGGMHNSGVDVAAGSAGAVGTKEYQLDPLEIV